METLTPPAILLCDDDILVVEKPVGLLTIPGGFQPDAPDLHHILETRFGRLWVVHRLDKDTSGIVLFARNENAHRQLNQQFEQRLVKKEYRAILYGNPSWNSHEIVLPLRINVGSKHRTIVDPKNGKHAQTHVRKTSATPDACQVYVHPKTGYTHQIRAHLNAIGYPLFFDPLYNNSRPSNSSILEELIQPNLRHLYLHACLLKFSHPVSDTPISIESPPPLDYTQVLDWLHLT